MKVSRRLFMRSAPLMPVAVQQAAKEAAISAVQAVNMPSVPVPLGSMGVSANSFGSYRSASKQALDTVAKLFAAGSRPQWRVAQDRIYAKRRAFLLDSDLEAMRSASPAFKRLRQTEREFDRILEEEAANEERNSGWAGMLAKFGYRED